MLRKIRTSLGLMLIVRGLSTLPILDREDYYLSMQVVQVGVTLVSHNSRQGM
jgi:hypothetical protein